MYEVNILVQVLIFCKVCGWTPPHSHSPAPLAQCVLKQLGCIRSLMREEIPSCLMALINHLSPLEVCCRAGGKGGLVGREASGF